MAGRSCLAFLSLADATFAWPRQQAPRAPKGGNRLTSIISRLREVRALVELGDGNFDPNLWDAQDLAFYQSGRNPRLLTVGTRIDYEANAGVFKNHITKNGRDSLVFAYLFDP